MNKIPHIFTISGGKKWYCDGLKLIFLSNQDTSSLTLSNSMNFSVRVDIWSLRRVVEWRPCKWWLEEKPVGKYSWFVILLIFIITPGDLTVVL